MRGAFICDTPPSSSAIFFLTYVIIDQDGASLSLCICIRACYGFGRIFYEIFCIE